MRGGSNRVRMRIIGRGAYTGGERVTVDRDGDRRLDEERAADAVEETAACRPGEIIILLRAKDQRSSSRSEITYQIVHSIESE